MKRHIPNTITLCNLLSGCVAIHFALQFHYDLALYAIIAGAVFDFFDGFAARLLGVSSPIGKELDSLADDVTFGVAPATVVYSLLAEIIPETPAAPHAVWLPYVAYIIAAFSALRLAKFNLDERQTTSFIGLPTPANTLFWAALAVGGHSVIIAHPTMSLWLLLLGIVLSSWLLVAPIPMFALKFKHFGWRDNALRYSFIIVSALLLAGLGWTAFSLIIVLYVLVSIITNMVRR